MQNTETAKKAGKNKKYMLVRYSKMNMLGLFEHHESHIPHKPTDVVVKTDRGLELGHLIGPAAAYKDGNFRLSANQITDYYDSDTGPDLSKTGTFIRYANAEDANEQRHLEQIAKDEIKCCENFVSQLELDMKIISAEHIFGGERIVFYFMADGRVDFRQLVRKLASEYQTRIEMRQIGARDEAQLLGDYETCGQQCCCQRFLRALKPVSMRMAKVQKATLDPSKISGYCGRLKCCLRYEDKTYTELKKNLPRRKACVKTEFGQGKVIETQILTQLVVVDHGDGKRVAINVEDIEVLPNPKPCPRNDNKGSAETKDNNNNNNDNKNARNNKQSRNNNRPRRGGNRNRNSDKSANNRDENTAPKK